MILVISTTLSLHPLSRRITDRVSFRVKTYALSATYPYIQFWFKPDGVSNQRLDCHIMIHRIDGTRMEKYYVGGSLFLAIALGFMSYLSRQLTYDPIKKECYPYDPNRVRGLLWQLGTQHLWNLFAMTGEIVTFLSIIVHMTRLKVFESRARRQNTTTLRLSASQHFQRPLGPKQYRNVVLRIALYPLSSLTTLGILTIWALYNISTGRPVPFKVLVALRTVYLSRGVIYGLVAAVDPAITQGVKVLYRHYLGRRTPSNHAVSADAHRFGDFELQELTSSTERRVTVSRAALFYLHLRNLLLPPRDIQLDESHIFMSTGVVVETHVGDRGRSYGYPELRQL
ncbi:hypothetical protein L218DRAFT_949683 [Marasmius fiardii PR-910]|nr:hypothetical protein L218DRAFT_949683 [Marasmius fiardii PR-910]